MNETWAALVRTVEKKIDANASDEYIGKVVNFFVNYLGFAEPALATAPHEMVMGHDKIPSDMRVAASISRIMTTVQASQGAKMLREELDTLSVVRQAAAPAAGAAAAPFPPQHPSSSSLVSKLERDSAM